MFCKKCGQEIKSGTKFCVKCGAPVQQGAEPAVSPQNGKKQGNGLLMALICIAVVLVLAVGGLGAFYFLSNRQEQETEYSHGGRDAGDDDDKDEESEDILTTESEDTAAVSTEMPERSESAATEIVEPAPPAESEAVVTQEDKRHTYQIVVKDVTWTEAYQEALAVPNGHLVTIETEEEWNTIMQQILAERREECIFWIGAIRRGNSSDYYWVDADGDSIGQPITNSGHWLAGEPTYYDAENGLEERYVDMFFSSSEQRWVWNDTPDNLIELISAYSGKVAYIVEIEHE